MKGSSPAWVIKSTWQKERRRGAKARINLAKRAKEAPHRLLLFAAFLGSPASDISKVLEVDRDHLVQMVANKDNRLGLCDLEVLLDWIGALWWRQLWRAGDDWAESPAAIEEAIRHTRRIRWLPEDMERALELAALEASKRCG